MQVENGVINSVLMNSGVYLVVVDNIPVYVGETDYFLGRFSNHLKNLYNDKRYFGIGNLQCDVQFIILKNMVKSTKRQRLHLESTFINAFKPILQKGTYSNNTDMLKYFKDGASCDAVFEDANIGCSVLLQSLNNRGDFKNIINTIQLEIYKGNFILVNLL